METSPLHPAARPAPAARAADDLAVRYADVNRMFDEAEARETAARAIIRSHRQMLERISTAVH
jgi:hypothetical protein